MRWAKRGLLFGPDGTQPWARSHASTPCAVQLPDGMLRVYFTARDASNRSHIGWADVDPEREFATIRSSEQPVLTPGSIGLFDDSGVAVGAVVPAPDGERLYYLGWNLRVTVPWTNTIGMAIRHAGSEAFVRAGRVPVMDRSEEDPYSLSYPSVLVEDGQWRMWYGSNLSWGRSADAMDHVVKYAESADGISWTRRPDPVVGLEHPGEYAISRPTVRRAGSTYEMYYCARGRGDVSKYRIGYATSADGLSWTRRDDEVGIDVSPDGWDSEMQCYPFVFEARGATWMLYNGNDYGRAGFGLAELVG